MHTSPDDLFAAVEARQIGTLANPQRYGVGVPQLTHDEAQAEFHHHDGYAYKTCPTCGEYKSMPRNRMECNTCRSSHRRHNTCEVCGEPTRGKRCPKHRAQVYEHNALSADARRERASSCKGDA